VIDRGLDHDQPTEAEDCNRERGGRPICDCPSHRYERFQGKRKPQSGWGARAQPVAFVQSVLHF
jgi:hypothetical protein